MYVSSENLAVLHFTNIAFLFTINPYLPLIL